MDGVTCFLFCRRGGWPAARRPDERANLICRFHPARTREVSISSRQIDESISIADFDFIPRARAKSRFLLPISSLPNRGADFYCRFLPAKIEDSISIADFQFLRRHFSASALRSYSYRLSFTIIIHYSTHHGRKNSIICSWQLGAAHLCWRRILCCLHCDIMPPQPQSP